jgi:cation-transporting ATPase E
VVSEPKAPPATTGLTRAEVAERVARGEVNKAAAQTGRSYWRILRENALAPFNVVLFGISIALAAVGLAGDALMTAALVLFNVVAGVFQEARAKRRLDQIALLVQPTATVIRDGVEVTVHPSEIVRDDVVVLRQGDEVPVDGIVLQAEGLSVDESLLSGESDYVAKEEGDRVYGGSFVTAGRGIIRADRVGPESMAQQITSRARAFQVVRTPLQREVSLVIVAMAIVVGILGVVVANSMLKVHGELPTVETLRAAAVIVALIPQGLAFMVTISYALGAVRIAGNGALVQRLNAVETMSHVDVLCLDKTGTLTTNELNLEALVPLGGVDEQQLRELLGRFAASVSTHNRTSAAIAAALPAEPWPAREELPFDSSRKWSAVVVDDETGARTVYVLGAPEVLASRLLAGAQLDLDHWLNEGLRVLMFARGAEASAPQKLDLADELTPLGIVVLRDELRHEAAATVQHFARAGIKLKVLSGDNPDAVASLARQAGIDGGRTVSGAEVEAADDEQLKALVTEASIFGRITPQHKERIIAALRSQGHEVAMIGDGVNDIPALKRASVSAAMRSGTPATRAVADIVLLNDSFSVLPAAFEEGQRIRAGMQTIIRLFLTRTLSMSTIILGASLLADPFPTTPRQAGIPALLTVGLPAFVLVFTAKPRRTERELLPASVEFVTAAALTIAVLGVALFHGVWQWTDDVDAARTALVVSQVLAGVVLIPYVRRESQNDGLLRPEVSLIPLAVAMPLLLIPCIAIAPLRDFFELNTLSAEHYAAIAGALVAWAAALQVGWRLRLRRREQVQASGGA